LQSLLKFGMWPTFQKIHDHVVILPLELGILVVLLPGGLEPSVPGRPSDNVDGLLDGVCLQAVIDCPTCDSAHLYPAREMALFMPNFAFFQPRMSGQRAKYQRGTVVELTLDRPVDDLRRCC
jgi:hypothetical protein